MKLCLFLSGGNLSEVEHARERSTAPPTPRATGGLTPHRSPTLAASPTWPEASRLSLQYVCTDMWKPYLNVVAECCGHAVQILDRFHVMKKFGEKLDKVRAAEARQMKADGYEPVLKNSRWCLLKRPENLTEKQTVKLKELLQYNLRSVRAYLMREDFQRFWEYRSAAWAGKFLDEWCTRAMRSQLGPMKEMAKTLRSHRELLLNWFRAKGELSSGCVEGLNAKAKLAMRKAYGFKSFETIEIALYHQLGKLPEPETTHRFCGRGQFFRGRATSTELPTP